MYDSRAESITNIYLFYSFDTNTFVIPCENWEDSCPRDGSYTIIFDAINVHTTWYKVTIYVRTTSNTQGIPSICTISYTFVLRFCGKRKWHRIVNRIPHSQWKIRSRFIFPSPFSAVFVCFSIHLVNSPHLLYEYASSFAFVFSISCVSFRVQIKKEMNRHQVVYWVSSKQLYWCSQLIYMNRIYDNKNGESIILNGIGLRRQYAFVAIEQKKNNNAT